MKYCSGYSQEKGSDPVTCTAKVRWCVFHDFNSVRAFFAGLIRCFFDRNIPPAIGRKSAVSDFHCSDFLRIGWHRIFKTNYDYLLPVIQRWVMFADGRGCAGGARTEDQDASDNDHGKWSHRFVINFVFELLTNNVLECL